MSDHLRNFQCWYSKILQDLSQKENSGLAMLIISFPLLERYLREKSRAYEDNHLPAAFFDELRKLFPTLADNSVARDFWHVFKHGLFHQVVLSQKVGKLGVLSSDQARTLSVDLASGRFELDPVQFVNKVVETIEADFETFNGTINDDHRVPKVHVLKDDAVSEPSGMAPSAAVADRRTRIIFSPTGHPSSNPLNIFNPMKIGAVLMVLGLLAFLLAQLGLDVPMLVKMTRDVEGPDGIIKNDWSEMHWLFVVEIVTFAFGFGLVLYGVFLKMKASQKLSPRASKAP